jgi:hypothetical protein
LLTALVLTACRGATGQSQPTAAPAATPVEEPASTQEPSQEPTPTTAPFDALRELPAASCCRGRPLEAGNYTMPAWLGVPLAMAVGDGWVVLNEARAMLLALGQGKNELNNPSRLLAFMDASPATPEEILADVQGMTQTTTLAGPTAVTIAGYDGLQLDSAANPNPDYAGSPGDDIPPGVQLLPVYARFVAPGFLWTTSSPEARVRTVALSVGDQTLLLYVEAPAADFDQFVTDAETILQTLELIEY